MIGTVRASLPRVIPRNATSIARTAVTKAERWTAATARDGKLLEQGSSVQLKDVLPNIESHWTKLSNEQQYSVYKQLEEIQRKDWHDLTINEQKGGMYPEIKLTCQHTLSRTAPTARARPSRRLARLAAWRSAR